mgnify:CR=1 FL=1
MADRDELIADVQAWLLRMPLNPGQLQQRAEEIVDGGIDLGGGRRIAIIERIPTADDPRDHSDAHLGGSQEQPFRIVTPDPGEA